MNCFVFPCSLFILFYYFIFFWLFYFIYFVWFCSVWFCLILGWLTRLTGLWLVPPDFWLASGFFYGSVWWVRWFGREMRPEGSRPPVIAGHAGLLFLLSLFSRRFWNILGKCDRRMIQGDAGWPERWGAGCAFYGCGRFLEKSPANLAMNRCASFDSIFPAGTEKRKSGDNYCFILFCI